MKQLGLLLLVSLVLSGCNLEERYARNNGDTAQWLRLHAGAPAVNISGHWTSEDWGDGQLVQKGSHVTGVVGKYPVGGSIDGRDLYLALTNDGWTYYTAILRANANGRTLQGFYSNEVPYSPSDPEPMLLTRTHP